MLSVPMLVVSLVKKSPQGAVRNSIWMSGRAFWAISTCFLMASVSFSPPAHMSTTILVLPSEPVVSLPPPLLEHPVNASAVTAANATALRKLIFISSPRSRTLNSPSK